MKTRLMGMYISNPNDKKKKKKKTQSRRLLGVGDPIERTSFEDKNGK